MADKGNTTLYQNIDVTHKENAEVEIKGEIPTEIMKKAEKEALSEFQKEAELPGFRKGNAPKDMVEKHIGEEKLLYEAAQKGLSKAYPEIIKSEKIDAIGQPHITITKMAKDNPLGFSIKTATMPNISVGDYKKIAKEEAEKKVKTPEVTDEEVEKVITQVRQNVAQADKKQKESEESSKDEEKTTKETPDDTQPELPQLTDEFVKSLGDFKNIEDFKVKIKENIKKEKEREEREKKRIALIEAIIKDSTIPVPEVMIESELNKMMAQFKADVERAGLTMEDYLKQAEKSEEDIKKEWREQAKKKAQTQLILNKIAAEEDIHADKDHIEKQVEGLKAQYGEANEDQMRVYVETVLTNEKVFEFLEDKAEDKKDSQKDSNKKED